MHLRPVVRAQVFRGLSHVRKSHMHWETCVSGSMVSVERSGRARRSLRFGYRVVYFEVKADSTLTVSRLACRGRPAAVWAWLPASAFRRQTTSGRLQ